MLCNVLRRRCALHGMLSRRKWVPWSETRGFCQSSEPGERGKYEAVIGIEVHAQLDVQTKLFSDARTSFADLANTRVALHDAAIPGTLPILSGECVRKAVITGIALGADVNLRSRFDRKHYFYADLPQGYQITQQYCPIVSNGGLRLDEACGSKQIRISRVHLEQDSGKSQHDVLPHLTLIDLNRCGSALVEIVSEPDLRSSTEAASYVRRLQALLRHVGVSEANMDEGSMRCDVNISVRRVGQPDFGVRCEVKNVNGVRFIQKAIDFEVRRHIDILESGGTVQQETRSFDASTGSTTLLRTKEEEVDYRYMPDPDLPQLELSQDYVESIRETMPELPDDMYERFVQEYGIARDTATALIMERHAAQYFDETVACGADPKTAANWVVNEVMGLVHADISATFRHCPVSPEQLSSVLKEVQMKNASGKIGKQIIKEMYDRKEEMLLAPQVMKEKGWELITDEDELRKLCRAVLECNPEQVAAHRAGSSRRVTKFFMGEIMRSCQGKAHPEHTVRILMEELET